ILHIGGGADVTLDGLTIANGSTLVAGGIFNDHGTLAVQDCTLNHNQGASAGGILNVALGGSATLRITNSTLSNNSATGYGGGIYNLAISGTATATINNSTLSNNSAGQGGGISNLVSQSGDNATLIVSNSTFSGNSASGD